MEFKLTLYSLFENCPRTSSKIVYCDGVERHSITFDELRSQVSYVAQHLESLSLSNTVVCSFMKPSLALPAVILGILKVSSTFAFLDIYKPLETLQAFQKNLEVKTLLVEECYLKYLDCKLCDCWKKTSQFSAYSDFIILQSTECKNDACPNSKEYKKHDWQSEIAYAILTSGTTGEPKVVQVPHDCIVCNIVDFSSRFSVSAKDVIILYARITFDPSIIEIFLSLSSGASLVIMADHIRFAPNMLVETIASNNVTILQGVPSIISNLGEKLLKEVLLKKESDLRILALGGEICPSVSKLRRWMSEGNETEIYNLYGLTEISCWASCFKIDFSKGDSLPSVPIGEPLLNTEFKILNEDGDITDKGELYIGGRKRFCIIGDEEWPETPDQFMRRTGDLVNKATDGFIYFEGRNDNSIKYKGLNVSLDNVMESFSEVANHFLYFDFKSSRFYLFVVWSRDGCSKSEFESRLFESLKKGFFKVHFIIVVPVPFIPVTKHGKCDSGKLMNALSGNTENKVSVENCDEMISTLWKKYTNQCNVTESDTFMLNGGDSITAVQFASEVEWNFQLLLPLLIGKVLTESFKDICDYVKCCLKADKGQRLLEAETA